MPLAVRLPLASALVALAAACAPRVAARPGGAGSDAGFDPARMRAEVAWLADPARTGRGTGTPGGPATAAWIAERLAEAGQRPAFDAGYLQTFEVPARAVGGPAARPDALRTEPVVTANVVAALPGRDPAVAGRCVVVGAHYDHLGHGGDRSHAPEVAPAVYPGANDNASGVAALLAVARAMAAEGPARRTIVFASFGAEELGLLGSAFLASHPPPGCPLETTQLMVNLDTVGKPQGGKVYADGTSSARGLGALVDAAASAPPPVPLTPVRAADVFGGSDQTAFLARGVPAVFLFTGADADYHRPSDTPDKLDYDGLAAVARLASRIVRAAADGPPLEPVRTAPAPEPPAGERERGYGAYLGAIPDFGPRAGPGVLLSGAVPGSPAAGAGLAAGDVLLRVGPDPVRSLRDLAHVLRAHRAGDEVEVEWERAGQRRTVKLRLGERR